MSERKIKLPKLKDLKKKREKSKEEPDKTARRAGALSVPESVGEEKTVTSREPTGRDAARHEDGETAEPSDGGSGVISSVAVGPGDRRSRHIEVPEHVRARYGRGDHTTDP